MAKLIFVFYLILVGNILNFATSSDISNATLTFNETQQVTDQASQNDIESSFNDPNGEIYFLDGIANDAWLDQMLEDTFNAILSDVTNMLMASSSNTDFLSSQDSALQTNNSISTSSLQDAEVMDLQIMEMIVNSTIDKLVDAIQEESQEAEADEELLEELKEELEAAKSLEEIIRLSLANQTEQEDEETASISNEESVGKYYVNRMRFWKQLNFEENTEYVSQDESLESIEFQEL